MMTATTTMPGPITRRYTFKLYPNAGQAAALQRQAALLAALWNAALEQREIQWAHECQRRGKGERKGLSHFDQARDLKYIRAADPEYAAMGAGTMALCLKALDDAFRAFFRRAKAGAGAASGYPRYKTPYAIESKGADCTIWHRDHRHGWRLDRAGRNFRIYAKGVPGTIRARGRFPVEVGDLELRDMRLCRRGGGWSASIVVRMEPRLSAGDRNIEVAFDLIDEFARVRIRADGECLPGWEGGTLPPDERISPPDEGVSQPAGPASPETGADGRKARASCARFRGPASPETGTDDRLRLFCTFTQEGPASPDTDVDRIQSEGDRRWRRFSNRWRREKRRIARIKARQARQRREALHRMTTDIIREASGILVVAPDIKAATASARGTGKSPGAAVRTVAMLNRHILEQAPAAAIQMLEYKAAEAAIPFARVTPDDHKAAVGASIAAAAKETRRARRMIRKQKELTHV